MSKGDTARIHYEMARSELIQRIQLRDNVLLLFLGAVGTVFGVVGTGGSNELLLIIPYLAFGASTIVEHHNGMLSLLGLFLSVELEPYYKKIDEYAPQWDTSSSLLAKSIKVKSHKESYDIKFPTLLRRYLGHSVLLLVPPIVGLGINYNHAYQWSYWTIAWWLGAFFTSLIFLQIKQSSDYRQKIYKIRDSEYR